MSSSTSPSGVEPSSQNAWQRYKPRSPSPRNPSRPRIRSAAAMLSSLTPSCSAVLRRSSSLEKYVRVRPFGSRSA